MCRTAHQGPPTQERPQARLGGGSPQSRSQAGTGHRPLMQCPTVSPHALGLSAKTPPSAQSCVQPLPAHPEALIPMSSLNPKSQSDSYSRGPDLQVGMKPESCFRQDVSLHPGPEGTGHRRHLSLRPGRRLWRIGRVPDRERGGSSKALGSSRECEAWYPGDQESWEEAETCGVEGLRGGRGGQRGGR